MFASESASSHSGARSFAQVCDPRRFVDKSSRAAMRSMLGVKIQGASNPSSHSAHEGMHESDRLSRAGSCGADTPTLPKCPSRRSASNLEDKAGSGLPLLAGQGPTGLMGSRLYGSGQEPCVGCGTSSNYCSGRGWKNCHFCEAPRTWQSGATASQTAAHSVVSLGSPRQRGSPPLDLHEARCAADLGTAPESTFRRRPTESIGSVLHFEGLCKPCAWYWKPQSCQNGRHCLHCHLCSADEPRRRRKQKKNLRRAALCPAPA